MERTLQYPLPQPLGKTLDLEHMERTLQYSSPQPIGKT